MLKFIVEDQTLKRVDDFGVVADSVEYLTAEFDYSHSDLNGVITAIFTDTTTDTKYEQILENGACIIPWEVINYNGFEVSLYSTNNTERITTSVVFIPVVESGYAEGETPSDPSPTVYEQILADLLKKIEAANILAGDNITLTKNGNNIIISSTGGSGSVTVDSSLYKDGDTIGIDFSAFDPTDEQTPFDKPNNALSASTIVSVLAKVLGDLADEFTIALNGKQNVLTAGAGISIANDVISATTGLTITVVEELPQTGNAQTIYLVSNDGSSQNIYDEYIYVNNAWEKIGTTDIDLSDYVTNAGLTVILSDYVTDTELSTALAGYATSSALTNGLATKQDVFTVGENLSLSNGTLSGNTLKFTTAQSKPANPNLNTVYGIVAGELFPDVSDYVTAEYPYITVFKRNGVTQLLLFKTENIRSSYGYYSVQEYKVATLVNGIWSELTAHNDANWYDMLGLTNTSSAIIDQNAKLKESVYYSTETFKTSNGKYPTWSDGDNTTTIAGVPLDPTLINRRILRCWKHNGTAWVDLGLVDYSEMFDDIYNKGEVDTALSGKQATLVNQSNIKSINGTSLLGSGDMSVQPVTATATITDNSATALADNTEYSGSNLTTVTFTYPQGDFECYLSLNFASSGTITVTFPTSQYIGSVPTFANGETWEISIKNGVIVAGEVTSGA